MDGRAETSIGAREALDGGDCLGARDGNGGLAFVAFGSRLAADMTREVEGVQRVVKPPSRAVPREPFAPRGDKPEVAVVAVGKPQRKRFV